MLSAPSPARLRAASCRCDWWHRTAQGTAVQQDERRLGRGRVGVGCCSVSRLGGGLNGATATTNHAGASSCRACTTHPNPRPGTYLHLALHLLLDLKQRRRVLDQQAAVLRGEAGWREGTRSLRPRESRGCGALASARHHPSAGGTTHACPRAQAHLRLPQSPRAAAPAGGTHPPTQKVCMRLRGQYMRVSTSGGMPSSTSCFSLGK